MVEEGGEGAGRQLLVRAAQRRPEGGQQAHGVLAVLSGGLVHPRALALVPVEGPSVQELALEEVEAVGDEPATLFGRDGPVEPVPVVGQRLAALLAMAFGIPPAQVGGHDVAHVVMEGQAVARGPHHGQVAETVEGVAHMATARDGAEHGLVELAHERTGLDQVPELPVLHFLQQSSRQRAHHQAPFGHGAEVGDAELRGHVRGQGQGQGMTSGRLQDLGHHAGIGQAPGPEVGPGVLPGETGQGHGLHESGPDALAGPGLVQWPPARDDHLHAGIQPGQQLFVDVSAQRTAGLELVEDYERAAGVDPGHGVALARPGHFRQQAVGRRVDRPQVDDGPLPVPTHRLTVEGPHQRGLAHTGRPADVDDPGGGGGRVPQPGAKDRHLPLAAGEKGRL